MGAKEWPAALGCKEWRDSRNSQAPRNPTRLNRAIRDFERFLKGIAEHSGAIIEGFKPGDPAVLPTLTQVLNAYADALRPWALVTAGKMLEEVNGRDRDSWRSLSNSISAQLREDILSAPVGETMRELLERQVGLIQSIPREAAERVHRLTLEGLEDSTRASEIAKEIMASGSVAKSRATLIARTEVGRTAEVLAETRAKHVGSEGYIWETAHDGDVRPSHKAMAGKFVHWDSPPTLDNLTGHAGALPNCRCWPRVILPSTPN